MALKGKEAGRVKMSCGLFRSTVAIQGFRLNWTCMPLLLIRTLLHDFLLLVLATELPPEVSVRPTGDDTSNY